MRSILLQIRTTLSAALTAAFGESASGVDPLIHVAGDPKFGDYQCNVAMGLAKKLGRKPRDIAQQIVDALSSDEKSIFHPPQIAGPGFINLRLKDGFLQKALESIPPAPLGEADQRRDRQGAVGGPQSADRLGIEPLNDTEKRTVVVDYSSPNVAKQMHVGHLRSSIIGDSICRLLEFAGHTVIRQNHIGDWGTPMGMVVVACMSQAALGEKLKTGTPSKDTLGSPESALSLLERKDNIAFLEALYKTSVQLCKEDAGYRDEVLKVTRQLQERDPAIVMIWKKACEISLKDAFQLYSRLNVQLGLDSVRGESFYEPFLSGVVEELRAALPSRGMEDKAPPTGKAESLPLPNGRGSEKHGRRETSGRSDALHAVCREDQGAVCVFHEKEDGSPVFKGPTGDPLPMIIRKSDGAFLYSTTDIAAILFRIAHKDRRPIGLQSSELADKLAEQGGGLGADWVIYVVGAPQKLHFEMLFATAGALGWTRKAGADVCLQHVTFGSILGENHKMLRTRSGENVKLGDLLDEAVRHAEVLVRRSEADPAKRRGFDEAEIKQIAETIGIAAVKYADLSQNRNSDYVFSWDKMLALQGNTAPYMLYAYARIRSIYRKGRADRPFEIDVSHAAIRLEHAAERKLALVILRFPDIINVVTGSLMPNHLCDYLYDIAGRFMVFYESCPVLKARNAETYASRLRLCDLAARALKIGLDLLGIKTLQRM